MKTELSLLKDNQQLVLKLQQTEGEVRVSLNRPGLTWRAQHTRNSPTHAACVLIMKRIYCFQALHQQNEQLEEAQLKANNRVSTHIQATQLLQTELQDSRAQVEEKENTIQKLKNKLRESEVRPEDLIPPQD